MQNFHDGHQNELIRRARARERESVRGHEREREWGDGEAGGAIKNTEDKDEACNIIHP